MKILSRIEYIKVKLINQAFKTSTDADKDLENYWRSIVRVRKKGKKFTRGTLLMKPNFYSEVRLIEWVDKTVKEDWEGFPFSAKQEGSGKEVTEY